MPAVDRYWTRVRVAGNFVLVAESSVATVYDWRQTSIIRSIWTDALAQSTAIADVDGEPMVVAFGDDGACCWSAWTGEMRWRRPDVPSASPVVPIRTPDAVHVGFTVIEKWGGPTRLLDLASGRDVQSPAAPKRRRFFATWNHAERYAAFDGQRVVVRSTQDDAELFSMTWRAHLDGVETRRETTPDGREMLVTTQSFDNPHPEGLVAFGDHEVLAVDTPDVVRLSAAGEILSKEPLPSSCRVVDVCHSRGRWHLLVRRPDRYSYDVLRFDEGVGLRTILEDCDGIALVPGAVLTSELEIVPLNPDERKKRLELPEPTRAQCSVWHPTTSEKLAARWASDWAAEPSDRPDDRRAAAVREYLAQPETASPRMTVHVPGPLSLDSPTARILEAFRTLVEANAPPEIRLDDLHSAEQGLREELPPFVVQLLAARAHYLETEWSLCAPRLAHTRQRGKQVLPAGLRALGYATGRRTWLCLRGFGADAHLYLFAERKRTSCGPFDAIEWLSRELAHLRERLRDRWKDGDRTAEERMRQTRNLDSGELLCPTDCHGARSAGAAEGPTREVRDRSGPFRARCRPRPKADGFVFFRRRKDPPGAVRRADRRIDPLPLLFAMSSAS